MITAGRTRIVAVLAVVLGSLGLAVTATAADVELPGSPTTTPRSADRPAGVASADPAPDPAATTKKVLRLSSLRLGARGEYVKDLQRVLRKRGIRVKVDGSFGLGTRRGVRIVQKRMKLRQTGVADVRLQRRLGLRPRKITVPVAQPIATGSVISVFPVASDYSYTNDFGAPRHQGSHQGIDIIAPKGTPVYAVMDGSIDRLTRAERGLGGIYIWQNSADRRYEYYYAHLDTIAPGLRDGSPVTAGQIIGTVGNTGDARFGVDHLHFETRRNNSSFSPHPHLVAADPNKRPRVSTRRN